MVAVLKTTIVQEPSSAVNNLTLDTSGGVTVGQNLSVTGTTSITGATTFTTNVTSSGTVVMSSPYTMRNKIINGAMVIDQRNAGASVTPASGAYTLDRWAVEMTQSSKFSIQQNAGSVTPPTGFSNYLGATSLSAYSVTSTDYFVIGQAIEGFNCADLAFGTASAQTITLSFWVRSSLTGTFGGTLLSNLAGRNYVFSYTVSSANTWEQKTITITGDTTGTWLTNNGAGLFVRFCIGAGASVVGAAGSWSATINRSVTGQTSVVGTNGATFYITGVQLERGTVATPFEYRNYQQELAMCQRYCPVFVANPAGGYQPFAVGQSLGTTQALITLIFPVSTRTPPTGITISAASDFACWQPSTSSTSATSITFNTATYLAGVIQLNGMSGLTQGYATTMISNNTANSKIIFTGSEL